MQSVHPRPPLFGLNTVPDAAPPALQALAASGLLTTLRLIQNNPHLSAHDRDGLCDAAQALRALLP